MYFCIKDNIILHWPRINTTLYESLDAQLKTKNVVLNLCFQNNKRPFVRAFFCRYCITYAYILHIMTMISEVRRWAGFTVYLAFSAIHLHWSCIICHNFAFLASLILFLHIYIFYSSNSVSSFAVADAWVIDSS